MARWEGSEVAMWERWENGEAERWEVPGFIQGCETQDFIFLFLILIKETKGWDGFKIFWLVVT